MIFFYFKLYFCHTCPRCKAVLLGVYRIKAKIWEFKTINLVQCKCTQLLWIAKGSKVEGWYLKWQRKYSLIFHSICTYIPVSQKVVLNSQIMILYLYQNFKVVDPKWGTNCICLNNLFKTRLILKMSTNVWKNSLT